MRWGILVVLGRVQGAFRCWEMMPEGVEGVGVEVTVGEEQRDAQILLRGVLVTEMSRCLQITVVGVGRVAEQRCPH